MNPNINQFKKIMKNNPFVSYTFVVKNCLPVLKHKHKIKYVKKCLNVDLFLNALIVVKDTESMRHKIKYMINMHNIKDLNYLIIHNDENEHTIFTDREQFMLLYIYYLLLGLCELPKLHHNMTIVVNKCSNYHIFYMMLYVGICFEDMKLCEMFKFIKCKILPYLYKYDPNNKNITECIRAILNNIFSQVLQYTIEYVEYYDILYELVDFYHKIKDSQKVQFETFEKMIFQMEDLKNKKFKKQKF